MSLKYLVLGHRQHGKDYFAELFTTKYELDFKSSSLFVLEKAVYPILSQRYGYASPEDCYGDRDNHRLEWKTLISDYNTPDKARISKEILAEYDMYVGMRDFEEYTASMKENLFDVVFYVNASPRRQEDDVSMGIPFDPSVMTLIDNSGTKENLIKIVGSLKF